MTHLVGIDVGGTFTDVFALDTATGIAKVTKTPTTRPDQSGGFLTGLDAVADVASVTALVHGTTAGTNALLERKGARIGVITTDGFRDVLEMRRRDRPATWGLRGTFQPVADRADRLEVHERTLADGTVRQAVDLKHVQAAAKLLADAGCQALAILFINAHANHRNEAAAAAAAREVWPNEHVCASHEIIPEIREFERFSTAALNATLQPEIGRYLSRLEDALASRAFDGSFMIVQSSGGIMTAETARRQPVRTALSGPAAGVIAAARIAEAAGHPSVITGDVGGTSFDVSLVADGQTVLAAQSSVAFGLVIRTPMVEITTIGAGGGSIAKVDKGGLLTIGPESAGSDPGPVAYNKGNDRPTVTDANIALGRIDPDRPIGGGALDVAAAQAAIAEHVGKPLGLSDEAAADAILKVANAAMAGAIRLVSVERGYDPKKFSYMPFGGGGALNACALIRDVSLARAIVPRYPGITSAMGCVLADMRQDEVQTLNASLDDLDEALVAEVIESHTRKGKAALGDISAFATVRVSVTFDMAYAGQTHTVAVPLPDAKAPTVATIRGAFEHTYKAAYGQTLSIPIRVLNVRTAVIGERPKFDLATLAPPADANLDAAARPARQVFMAGEWQDCAIYDRLAMPAGATISGPAILEQPDTTILVEPGATATIDPLGNVIITLDAP
ncbi:MAG: hydantoinase/oxoprolinase family protein [Pseudomonadota bacterium]